MALSLVPVGLSSLYYQESRKESAFPVNISAAGCRSPSPETLDSGRDVFTVQSNRSLAPSICSSRLIAKLTLNYHFKPEGDNEKGCSLNSERSYSLLR